MTRLLHVLNELAHLTVATLTVAIFAVPRPWTSSTQVYWRPGNSAAFLSLVEQLTGKPLDGSAWVETLATPVEVKVCCIQPNTAIATWLIECCTNSASCDVHVAPSVYNKKP